MKFLVLKALCLYPSISIFRLETIFSSPYLLKMEYLMYCHIFTDWSQTTLYTRVIEEGIEAVRGGDEGTEKYGINGTVTVNDV